MMMGTTDLWLVLFGGLSLGLFFLRLYSDIGMIVTAELMLTYNIMYKHFDLSFYQDVCGLLVVYTIISSYLSIKAAAQKSIPLLIASLIYIISAFEMAMVLVESTDILGFPSFGFYSMWSELGHASLAVLLVLLFMNIRRVRHVGCSRSDIGGNTNRNGWSCLDWISKVDKKSK